MINFYKMYRYLKIASVVGTGITAANLANIKRSPVLTHENRDRNTDLSILTFTSIGKGLAYGLFFPLSCPIMLWSLSNEIFHRNIVPGQYLHEHLELKEGNLPFEPYKIEFKFSIEETINRDTESNQ